LHCFVTDINTFYNKTHFYLRVSNMSCNVSSRGILNLGLEASFFVRDLEDYSVDLGLIRGLGLV